MPDLLNGVVDSSWSTEDLDQLDFQKLVEAYDLSWVFNNGDGETLPSDYHEYFERNPWISLKENGDIEVAPLLLTHSARNPDITIEINRFVHYINFLLPQNYAKDGVVRELRGGIWQNLPTIEPEILNYIHINFPFTQIHFRIALNAIYLMQHGNLSEIQRRRLAQHCLHTIAPLIRTYESPYITYALEYQCLKILDPQAFTIATKLLREKVGERKLTDVVEEVRSKLQVDLSRLGIRGSLEVRPKSLLSLLLKFKEGRSIDDWLGCRIILEDDYILYNPEHSKSLAAFFRWDDSYITHGIESLPSEEKARFFRRASNQNGNITSQYIFSTVIERFRELGYSITFTERDDTFKTPRSYNPDYSVIKIYLQPSNESIQSFELQITTRANHGPNQIDHRWYKLRYKREETQPNVMTEAFTVKDEPDNPQDYNQTSHTMMKEEQEWRESELRQSQLEREEIRNRVLLGKVSSVNYTNARTSNVDDGNETSPHLDALSYYFLGTTLSIPGEILLLEHNREGISTTQFEKILIKISQAEGIAIEQIPGYRIIDKHDPDNITIYFVDLRDKSRGIFQVTSDSITRLPPSTNLILSPLCSIELIEFTQDGLMHDFFTIDDAFDLISQNTDPNSIDLGFIQERYPLITREVIFIIWEKLREIRLAQENSRISIIDGLPEEYIFFKAKMKRFFLRIEMYELLRSEKELDQEEVALLQKLILDEPYFLRLLTPKKFEDIFNLKLIKYRIKQQTRHEIPNSQLISDAQNWVNIYEVISKNVMLERNVIPTPNSQRGFSIFEEFLNILEAQLQDSELGQFGERLKSIVGFK